MVQARWCLRGLRVGGMGMARATRSCVADFLSFLQSCLDKELFGRTCVLQQ